MSCCPFSFSQTPINSATVKHTTKFKFIANLWDVTGNISMVKDSYSLKQLSLMHPQWSMAVLHSKILENLKKKKKKK